MTYLKCFIFYLTIVVALLQSLSALAVVEVEPLSSPELQARYKTLIEELRCPKCQNQNLADSGSPIAADLRREIRHLLEQGRSDSDITEYLVDRYGDFVLYRPPLQQNTLLLWLAPAALLLIGMGVFAGVIRHQRQGRPAVAAPVSPSNPDSRSNQEFPSKEHLSVVEVERESQTSVTRLSPEEEARLAKLFSLDPPSPPAAPEGRTSDSKNGSQR